MKRYLPSIKRYWLIVIVCAVLAAGVGFVIAKQQEAFQASSMIQVNIGNGDGFLPKMSPNDGIGYAANDVNEIATGEVMKYIYQHSSNLQKAGYSVGDLVSNVKATSVATGSQITITATAPNKNDAATIANEVAQGYINYKQDANNAMLKAQRTSLQNQINAVAQQIGTARAKVAADPAGSAAATVDAAAVQTYQHTSDTLDAQLAAMPVLTTSGLTLLHLVGPTDATPTNKLSMTLAVSVLVGLLIGSLIVLLIIFLDNKLTSEEQVTDQLKLTYLGSLPHDGEMASAPTQARGTITHDLADIGSNLRLTGVLPSQWRAPQGVILLVTSAQTTEGKTSIAAALAATMARGGCSTLVIDGNLAQPATHLTFGMSPSGPGLSGLLKSGGNVDDAVKTSSVPGVWMLPGGSPVADSALLLGQRLPNILAQLRKKTDLIIIDGPSLLTGAEASVLASMVDGVMMIVDYRHAKMNLLQRAKELLTTLADTPAGVVLNNYTRTGTNNYFAKVAPQPFNRQLAGMPQEAIIPPAAAVMANGQPPVMPMGAPVAPAAKPKSSLLNYSQGPVNGGLS
ncbi:hypothetical protein EPA93_41065 [Ktedonosporobacter rubrisoli]|uniref:Uncharacterized protein n=1 Tax=Ktedonosporobacter rubrisoli TaxID=2509675 RepID=A0A4P6K2B3_KTERU|nr:polysaccharide biosynthesis tyrosine autokinase [Ktedonosporobacter rubrisoli]QBD82032.1 hypothetical protein EPA93_41065 [Ktedonosporobacter rubrisoli]